MCINASSWGRGISASSMVCGAGHSRRQSGVTLVELIVFIVIVSVGVVGLLSVTASLTRYSPDPMIRKQMIAIAESLLHEVLQQPFTYCDPNDSDGLGSPDPDIAAKAKKAAEAKSTDDCIGGAAGSQDKGGAALSGASPSTETRYASSQFDNVADYGGFTKVNVDDVIAANAMTGYTASIAVTRVGTTFSIPADAALRITVTVQYAGQDDFALNGYRFRYAPRS